MREVELHEVCDVIAGQSPPSSTYNQDGIGVPFFQGKADFGEKFPTVRYWCTEPKRFTSPGDLLFSLRAPVGPTNFNQVEASIGRGLAAIRCREGMDVNFLRFYFLHNEDKIEALGNGSTFKAITNKTLKALKVPLPPLQEQKRIAGILDEADRVRKKTQALIDKYDELAQSIFLDMFGDPVTNPKGWEVKPLGELAHLKAGKFVRASDISEECDEGMHPCYGGNGLRGFVESTTHEGEFVLIGRQGALCGNVKLVKGLFHATEHAVVCTPSLSYESEWFYHLLVMLELNRFATGAAQPGLNVGTLNEISVPYPPQELQQSFSVMIKNLTAQKELTDQGAQESQEIFQALLQKAFKGELT